MILSATYFGFHPLGGEAELEGVKILQKPWHPCKGVLLILGKKHIVSPLFSSPCYVETEAGRVYFSAVEHGVGKYHIFSFTPTSREKLQRRCCP